MNNKQESQLIQDLQAVFPFEVIKWKVITVIQSKKNMSQLLAQVAPYIDARELMNRFDTVLGQNWSTNYTVMQAGQCSAIECTISINLDGKLSARSDAADLDFNQNSNAGLFKSGYSNSFKRASIAWGVSRYLKSFKPIYVPINKTGTHYVGGNYKVNNASTNVRGFFDVPVSLYNNQVSNNTNNPIKPATTVKTAVYIEEDFEEGVPEHILKVRKNINDILRDLDISADDLLPQIQKINPKESSLREASMPTLTALYKSLKNVQMYISSCKRLNIDLKMSLYFVSEIHKVPVNNIQSLIFLLDDDHAKNEANQRIKHFRKSA